MLINRLITLQVSNLFIMIKTKKRLRLFLVFFSLKLIFCMPIEAQTEKTLTIDDAVDLGLKNSNQIKISMARLNVVTSKRQQYWNAQLPNVTASAGYTRISDNIETFSVRLPGSTDAVVLNPQILNQYSMRLGAQQTVFSGFRAINFYKSSEFQEKAAASDVDKDKTEVKNLVETTFLNILKLQRTKQILEQNATVFESRKKDAQNFFKSGTGLENDVLKTDLALLQIKTTQSEVENFIKAAKYNLIVLLSLPDDTNLILDEKNAVAEPLTVSDLNAYVKMVDARPEIAATSYRKQASESLLEVAKGNYFPTVGVFGNIFNSNANLRVFPQVDQFKATWELGLTLNYNITNLFTNKYQVNEAKANIDVAQNQRGGLVNIAKTEVSNAFYALQTANDKLELYKQAVTQSIENARVIKNRYNSQISTVTESLDADFQALQAKINLENAVLDSEIARRKLLKTVAK